MVSNTNSKTEEEILLELAQEVSTTLTGYDPRLSEADNFLNFYQLKPTDRTDFRFRVPFRAIYKLYLEYKDKHSKTILPISRVQLSHAIAAKFQKTSATSMAIYLIANASVVKELIQDEYFERREERQKERLNQKSRTRYKGLSKREKQKLKDKVKARRQRIEDEKSKAFFKEYHTKKNAQKQRKVPKS